MKGLFMLSTTDSSRLLNMKRRLKKMFNNAAQSLTLESFSLSRPPFVLSLGREKIKSPMTTTEFMCAVIHHIVMT